MTASIMSAVPPRRAGAGSAMNDTTRELGAALGVAVLGSLAASRYASGLRALVRPLAPAARATAQSSLAGALQVAGSLPHGAGSTLASRADRAFVDGFHLAGIVGAVLAAASAVIVACYLPRRVSHAEAQPAPVEVDLGAIVPDYPEEEDQAPVAG
jgi:hypothetical protein